MLKDIVKRVPGARKVAQAVGLVPKDAKDRRIFLLEMLPKGSVGAEIGVERGHFSQRILNIVKPKELHLIDPWKYEASGTYRSAGYGGHAKRGQEEMDERFLNVCARFAREVRHKRVKIHRDYSTNVLRQFPDEYFDWIYIDGNHLYEYVKRDLELSFLKIKVAGFMAGDDYMDKGWWEDGVTKAVDEFARTHRSVVGHFEFRNHQFIFRKILRVPGGRFATRSK